MSINETLRFLFTPQTILEIKRTRKSQGKYLDAKVYPVSYFDEDELNDIRPIDWDEIKLLE